MVKNAEMVQFGTCGGENVGIFRDENELKWGHGKREDGETCRNKMIWHLWGCDLLTNLEGI